MTIYYDKDCEMSFDFDYEQIAELVIKRILLSEHFPYDVEISISFVNDEAIKRINKEYRNIHSVTDVLSFPMIDFDKKYTLIKYRSENDYSFIEGAIDYNNLDTNEVSLGDIVLCVPKIYEQAKEYNHSILREYSFLIAHSMLHLLGYDHEKDEERVVMEQKQNSILESLNITRDL